MLELQDYKTGEILLPQVTVAGAFSLKAMRGLIGRTEIDPNEGLLLRDPLCCLHTFGMRCAIDMVFLGRDGRVLGVASRVPPRRIRRHPGGVLQLELAAGQASLRGLVPGRRLRVINRPAGLCGGQVRTRSPHRESGSGIPQHSCVRAACGDGRDLHTVLISPRQEAPPGLDAMSSPANGSIQRS